MFRIFIKDPFSQATGAVAKGAFIVGLLLIGFGLLVFVLRDLFAFIAAAIFFMAGFSAIGYAIRLWIVQYKLRKSGRLYQPPIDFYDMDEL